MANKRVTVVNEAGVQFQGELLALGPAYSTVRDNTGYEHTVPSVWVRIFDESELVITPDGAVDIMGAETDVSVSPEGDVDLTNVAGKAVSVMSDGSVLISDVDVPQQSDIDFMPAEEVIRRLEYQDPRALAGDANAGATPTGVSYYLNGENEEPDEESRWCPGCGTEAKVESRMVEFKCRKCGLKYPIRRELAIHQRGGRHHRVEASPGEKAKEMGLVHKGFGNYGPPDGATTHKSTGGKLVEVGAADEPSGGADEPLDSPGVTTTDPDAPSGETPDAAPDRVPAKGKEPGYDPDMLPDEGGPEPMKKDPETGEWPRDPEDPMDLPPAHPDYRAHVRNTALDDAPDHVRTALDAIEGEDQEGARAALTDAGYEGDFKNTDVYTWLKGQGVDGDLSMEVANGVESDPYVSPGKPGMPETTPPVELQDFDVRGEIPKSAPAQPDQATPEQISKIADLVGNTGDPNLTPEFAAELVIAGNSQDFADYYGAQNWDSANMIIHGALSDEPTGFEASREHKGAAVQESGSPDVGKRVRALSTLSVPGNVAGTRTTMRIRAGTEGRISKRDGLNYQVTFNLEKHGAVAVGWWDIDLFDETFHVVDQMKSEQITEVWADTMPGFGDTVLDPPEWVKHKDVWTQVVNKVGTNYGAAVAYYKNKVRAMGLEEEVVPGDGTDDIDWVATGDHDGTPSQQTDQLPQGIESRMHEGVQEFNDFESFDAAVKSKGFTYADTHSSYPGDAGDYMSLVVDANDAEVGYGNLEEEGGWSGFIADSPDEFIRYTSDYSHGGLESRKYGNVAKHESSDWYGNYGSDFEQDQEMLLNFIKSRAGSAVSDQAASLFKGEPLSMQNSNAIKWIRDIMQEVDPLGPLEEVYVDFMDILDGAIEGHHVPLPTRTEVRGIDAMRVSVGPRLNMIDPKVESLGPFRFQDALTFASDLWHAGEANWANVVSKLQGQFPEIDAGDQLEIYSQLTGEGDDASIFGIGRVKPYKLDSTVPHAFEQGGGEWKAGDRVKIDVAQSFQDPIYDHGTILRDEADPDMVWVKFDDGETEMVELDNLEKGESRRGRRTEAQDEDLKVGDKVLVDTGGGLPWEAEIEAIDDTSFGPEYMVIGDDGKEAYVSRNAISKMTEGRRVEDEEPPERYTRKLSGGFYPCSICKENPKLPTSDLCKDCYDNYTKKGESSSAFQYAAGQKVRTIDGPGTVSDTGTEYVLVDLDDGEPYTNQYYTPSELSPLQFECFEPGSQVRKRNDSKSGGVVKAAPGDSVDVLVDWGMGFTELVPRDELDLIDPEYDKAVLGGAHGAYSGSHEGRKHEGVGSSDMVSLIKSLGGFTQTGNKTWTLETDPNTIITIEPDASFTVDQDGARIDDGDEIDEFKDALDMLLESHKGPRPLNMS